MAVILVIAALYFRSRRRAARDAVHRRDRLRDRRARARVDGRAGGRDRAARDRADPRRAPAWAGHGLHDLLHVRRASARLRAGSRACRRARRDARGSARSCSPRASSSPAARPRCWPASWSSSASSGRGSPSRALVVTVVCVTLVPAVLGLAGPRLFGPHGARGRSRRADEPAVAAHRTSRRRRPTARRARWRLRTAGARGAYARAAATGASRAARRSHLRHPAARAPSGRGARRRRVRRHARRSRRAAARSIDLGVAFVPSLPDGSEPRRAADDAARGFVPGITRPADVILEQRGIARRPSRAARRARRASRGEPGVAAVPGRGSDAVALAPLRGRPAATAPRGSPSCSGRTRPAATGSPTSSRLQDAAAGAACGGRAAGRTSASPTAASRRWRRRPWPPSAPI